MPGTLTIVGTGIGPVTRVTPETRTALERADDVLYLVDDPVAEAWISEFRTDAQSLRPLYATGKPRQQTYGEIVERLLEPVRRGRRVCAAFYGHPGVFVWPSHEAVRRARAEGLDARMLPAISSEDCLFADLGVDPGVEGCQSYEATRFLVYGHAPDPRAGLVLWQVGAIGDTGYPPRASREARRLLVDYLASWYPRDHGVILYQAAPLPVFEPVREHLTLAELPEREVPAMSTLWVPPVERPRRDARTAARLGLPPGDGD